MTRSGKYTDQEQGANGFVAMRDATARAILNEHGDEAFRVTKRAASFHGAAQAVVGRCFGDKITELKILSKSGDAYAWRGLCNPGITTLNPAHKSLLDSAKHIARLLAGWSAEHQFLAGTPDFAEGASVNESMLARALAITASRKCRHDDNELFMLMIAYTHEMLRTHEQTLREIANILEQKLVFDRRNLAWLAKQVPKNDFELGQLLAEYRETDVFKKMKIALS
jgi:hypothetical protein